MSLYHASIILSNGSPLQKVADILLQEISFDIKGNPDFWLIEEESFSIDSARDLEKWAIGKPLVGDQKVCLIVSKSINFEAQNAMLKMLEEPKEGTYFFLSVESLGTLLPTLLSRVQVVDWGEKREESEKAKKFVKGDISERLAIVRTLQKNTDKTKIKEFIADLENLAREGVLNFTQKDNILKAKIYSMQRGASGKMLLEWLSCAL